MGQIMIFITHATLPTNAAGAALRTGAALAILFGLSACGGGGATTSMPPATNPPAPTAPSSTQVNDLITFAAEGGTLSTLQTGVTRQTRTFTSNGTPGVVAVDRLAGTDVGLVQYRLGSDVFLYSLTGDPVGMASLPSGTFSGPLALNFRLDQNSGWTVMAGDANLSLNMATGRVGLGGIATDFVHSVELFGEANLVDGRFQTDAATLRLRDAAGGGMFIRDETGSVAGTANSQGGNHAIFGTLAGNNPSNGFQLNGGFTTTFDQN